MLEAIVVLLFMGTILALVLTPVVLIFVALMALSNMISSVFMPCGKVVIVAEPSVVYLKECTSCHADVAIGTIVCPACAAKIGTVS